MGNLNDYKRVWQTHTKEIRSAVYERDAALTKITKLEGSQEYEERRRAIQDAFDSRITANRAKYINDVDVVLAAMRKKAEAAEGSMKPPSDEQMRLLQTVSLMPSLDMDTYNAAMRELRDSNAAALALWSMAKGKFSDSVTGDALKKPETLGGKSLSILKDLTNAARSIAAWSGMNRLDALLKSNEERRAGIAPSGRTYHTTHCEFADVNPDSDSFFRDVVSLDTYDKDALKILD